MDEHGQEMCSVISDGLTVGVMMGWEQGISMWTCWNNTWNFLPDTKLVVVQATVHKLCADHPLLSSGLRILNIGFGLGIVLIVIGYTSRFSAVFLDRHHVPKFTKSPICPHHY